MKWIGKIGLLFLVVGLGLCGCRATRQMRHLESVIRANPDSVLAGLEEWGPLVRGVRNRSYLALLKSMALDLCYVDVDNDSLINIAGRYYERAGDVHHKMLYQYYRAVVMRNARRSAPAAIAFDQALPFARKENNLLYQGLIHRNLYELYGYCYEDVTAEDHIRRSIDCFEEGGYRDYALFSRLELARVLQHSNQLAKSDSVYTQLLREVDGDSFLYDPLCRSYASFLMLRDDEAAALELYGRLPIESLTAEDWANCGYASYVTGNKKDSERCFLEAEKRLRSAEDSALFYYNSYLVRRGDGQFKEALNYHKRTFDIQDSVTTIKLRQSLSNAFVEAYQKEILLRDVKSKLHRQREVILAVLALVVLFFILLRLRTKNRENRNLVASLSEMERNLRMRSDENFKLVKDILLSRLSSIFILTKEYETALQNDKKGVYEKIKAALDGFHALPDFYDELEGVLNAYRDNLMKNLREEFPDLKESHYHLLSLFFCGIPYDTVLFISKHHSMESLRTMKYRFRKMFKDTPAPHSEVFLAAMDGESCFSQ